MRFAWVSAVATMGCSFNPPEVVDDARPGPDGSVDAPSSSICYGALNGLVTPCFPAVPTGDLVLTAAVDTTNALLCSTDVMNAPSLCVIARATITVPAGTTVAVTGDKPLVLVATGTISINGVLDAASRHAQSDPFNTVQVGAGADPINGCNAASAPGASGGGAGGTFIALGGSGGTGNAGSIGGTPGAPQPRLTLRGGCNGQSALGTLGGLGGRGGGAVYLIAGRLDIEGTINASGEGGGRGITGANAAGGGGGSGGLIGLDAPVINNTGLVFANGGGGGEGSGGGSSGLPGSDPTSVTPAAGGAGGSTAGNGGIGGAGGTGGGTVAGGNGQSTANDGAGGGGGGAGVIKVYRGTLGGSFSPPPS